MADQRIAKLIAERLQAGITHPGDPARDIPPRPIALPFGSAPGRPKEMEDMIAETVKLLSEAIVYTIEVDGESEIVANSDLTSLRAAAGQGPEGPRVSAMHCRCDTARNDPLAMLTIPDEGAIIVDAAALIRSLSTRTAAHPHKAIQ